jgi:hypothetical protein
MTADKKEKGEIMRLPLKLWLVACSAFLLSVPAASTAQGPQQRGAQGWGPAGAYGRLYDASKVEKLSGDVLEIRKITPMRGMSHGVAIVVKASGGDVLVYLGPAWYVENQDTRIAKGNQVEVEGSRVTLGGKPVILAARVRKGDQVLQLRDDAGVPAWAGWRRAQSAR